MLSASIKRNKEEGGAQVLRMFPVYQMARIVAIWLGPGAKGSNKIVKVLSLVRGIEPEIDYRERFLGPRLDDDEEPPTPEE
jgi:hypothetical protein